MYVMSMLQDLDTAGELAPFDMGFDFAFGFKYDIDPTIYNMTVYKARYFVKNNTD